MRSANGGFEPSRIDAMTISISLTPEAETKLRQRAARLGQDLSIVVSDLFEEAVRRPSVDELLAPARKQVAESGLDDRALDDFFRATLKEGRAERRTKPR